MRLLCAISHHGLGHLAQTSALLHALQERRPDLEWLLWSGLSRATLARRLQIPFSHRPDAADMGLAMEDALRVDTTASHAALAGFHAHWSDRVQQEAAWMRAQGIQGVISNVAYLPLAAARASQLPAIAFCSLNWWDITRHYLGHGVGHEVGHGVGNLPAMDTILEQMRTAYLDADRFFRLTPGLPMPWLPQAETIPPLAQLGRNVRTALDARLNLGPNQKLVLMGLGGVHYQPPAPLPPLENVVWLVPDNWHQSPGTGEPERPDLVHLHQCGHTFQDLLASCDALVTKVGYGSYTEAAGAGCPTLYLDRPDWPEAPWLNAWLERNTRALAIREAQLFSPEIGEWLAKLWRMPPTTPAAVSGTRPGTPSGDLLGNLSGADVLADRILATLG